MTREEKINLLNKLLEIEEKLDIGNLTRAEKGEFRQWVETLEQEQEPMVEIDLYSVIKQKYIEREVLDKIRAEIETKYGQCKLTEYIVQYDGICTSVNDIGDIADILQIIDKYKVEQEET